jgi:hypothetical protein
MDPTHQKNLEKKKKKKKKKKFAKTTMGDVIRGELTVTVVSGRELPSGDFNGKSDPYVQVRVGKGPVRKTHAVRSTLDPQWRESFTFRVEDCMRQTLFAEVWDKDYGTADDYLGEVKVHTRALVAAPRNAAWFSLQHKSGKAVRGQLFLDIAFVPDGGIAQLAQLGGLGPAPSGYNAPMPAAHGGGGRPAGGNGGGGGGGGGMGNACVRGGYVCFVYFWFGVSVSIPIGISVN